MGDVEYDGTLDVYVDKVCEVCVGNCIGVRVLSDNTFHTDDVFETFFGATTQETPSPPGSTGKCSTFAEPEARLTALFLHTTLGHRTSGTWIKAPQTFSHRERYQAWA